MGKKRILVGYGVDIDAVSGWLGSYGGEDSVSDISRGNVFFKLNLPLSSNVFQVSGPATLEQPAFSNFSKNTTSKQHGSSPVTVLRHFPMNALRCETRVMKSVFTATRTRIPVA